MALFDDSRPLRLGIVGCGLIGGSAALAAHLAGADVVVYDPDAATRDLVVLATPTDSLVRLATHLAGVLEPHTVVTDLASSKAALPAIRTALAANQPYVSVHPMAGSQHHGFAHASADLLADATWIVCAAPDEVPPALTAFVSLMQPSRTLFVDPPDHDHVTAVVSHLPQLAASLLAATIHGAISTSGLAALEAAGGGFKDTTHIAESPLHVWRPIVADNSANIVPLLRDLAERTAALAHALENGDLDALTPVFSDANAVRAAWRAAKGLK